MSEIKALDPALVREHPYYFLGIENDALCALGLFKPTFDMVLLRTITLADTKDPTLVDEEGRAKIVLEGMDHSTGAQLYEIMAVGPCVERAQAYEGEPIQVLSWEYPAGSLANVRPGMFCVHVASGADRIGVGTSGQWETVRARYLSTVLDPLEAQGRVAELMETLEAMNEQARRENLGLPPEA